mmetsp:Transcript_27431/g.47360  ORF Transcript_27431/g.47360 Transcript_27431/m.47360 type:complete len:100 (+) Transcript_27431:338-637(+)
MTMRAKSTRFSAELVEVREWFRAVHATGEVSISKIILKVASKKVNNVGFAEDQKWSRAPIALLLLVTHDRFNQSRSGSVMALPPNCIWILNPTKLHLDF